MNTGYVHGATYAIGGIAGYGGDKSVVEGCVNGGEVRATGTSTKKYGTAAGILGYGYTRVMNCANFGPVSGTDYVAGIAGTGFAGIAVDSCYNAGTITAAENALNVGNIYSSAEKIGSRNYYLSSVSSKLPTDVEVDAKGIDETGLMDLDLGNGFLDMEAEYPVPVSAAEFKEVRFHTVRYALSEGDTPENVSADFHVGHAEGIEWTASDPELAVISGGTVSLAAADNRKLTLSCTDGDRVKTFDFTINTQSGVDVVEIREIIERAYFTTDGIPVRNPEKGTVCVVVTRYADGTAETVKAVIR